MKLFENNKGITLAVLVVTIVVLLILAGITISNITGGDGILGQAQSKKDAATIQKEKTILGSAVMTASNKTKLGDLTEENLRDALSNKNVDIVKSGGLYKITFKDTNNLYKMNENGEYFYWENMQPTDIYAKKEGTILYLRSTQPDTSYVKGTAWSDSSIKKIIIEEPIAPTTCQLMFRLSGLEEIENIENLHTENVTSMYGMFHNCQNLINLDVSKFDTSKVTRMDSMFYYCKSLKNLNVSNFDTSNVITMESMFNRCQSLSTININNFITKNVYNMSGMFSQCYELQSIDVSNFDTSKVTNLSNMFLSCSK